MSPDGVRRGGVGALDPPGPTTGEVVADDPLDRARQLLREEGRKRADAAANELKVLLEKYRCRLSTRQEYVDGQPVTPPQVVIVPMD